MRNSFALCIPCSEQFAAHFFNKLFLIDPALSLLLKQDQKVLEQRLMAMISAIVNGLEDIDILVPILQDFGKQHAEVNVDETHYSAVKTALFFALENVLENDWTADVKDAWEVIFTVIIDIMKEAATSMNEIG